MPGSLSPALAAALLVPVALAALAAPGWRQYRQAERARAETRALLDAVSEVIVFLTPDRHVLAANRRFAELFGAGQDQLAGRPLTALRADIGRIFADPAAVLAGVAATAGAAERRLAAIPSSSRPRRTAPTAGTSGGSTASAT